MSGRLLVVRIDWTEHELGWGSRPDGTSLHVDFEVARQFMAAAAERQRAVAAANKGRVLDTSHPGTPRWVRLPDDRQALYDQVQKEKNCWWTVSSHAPATPD